VHDHLLAEQGAHVKASDRGKAQEPTLDLGDHEADFVHMPGQHHARMLTRGQTLAPLESDDVAQRIAPHLVGQLSKDIGDNARDFNLGPRHPTGLADLLEKLDSLHASLLMSMRAGALFERFPSGRRARP